MRYLCRAKVTFGEIRRNSEAENVTEAEYECQ